MFFFSFYSLHLACKFVMLSRKLVILLLHSVSFFLYKGTVPIKVTKAIHTALKWSKHAMPSGLTWVNI